VAGSRQTGRTMNHYSACFHINFLYGRTTILACEVVKGSAHATQSIITTERQKPIDISALCSMFFFFFLSLSTQNLCFFVNQTS
jgi:hypothetical protein